MASLNFTSEFIVSVICFLGLYVGLLISYMAKEEELEKHKKRAKPKVFVRIVSY